MNDLAVSPALLQTAPTAPSGPEARRMRETAEQFEASFLSQMLKPMFEGLDTNGLFGGGEAEATWRGFLVDAMAQQTVRAGGIGLADTVMAEMIRMQSEQTAGAAA
ncbi:rod-binding protein [Brevundimonas bacteroides]|uniref:rod-binding protein n=1 Tax=Brevundimonas bacteroides TaxID=74311 RepID=UPI0004969E7F|nr:rod-binding protein [Brevundimonas bacteroides]